MNTISADAVIFDFDGVLAESVEVKTTAFAQLFAPYGNDIVKQVVQYHLTHGGISRFEKFHYYYNNLLGKPLSREEETVLGEKFSQLVVEEVVASPWTPGAEKCLQKWQQTIPLFVASGTPEQELIEIIKRRKMANFFRSVHGSPTHKEEIIESLLEKYQFSRTRVLMVGDAMTDFNAAKTCNIKFLGRVPKGEENPFPHGTQTISDLTNLELV